ncbi:hypothetical protein [Dietzia sp. KRD202]|nr:hypothetical protein [Dietzia sp. KRD202]
MRWQVAPQSLHDLWRGKDREAAARAFAVMMDMVKLDVSAIEAAAAGTDP